MERIRLKTGHTFSVPGKAGTYTIRKTIGEGGSCVVYLADFKDGNGITTEHILKEYYPKDIAISRDETGFLCAKTEEAKEAFDNGLEHFQSGYKKQSEIRRIVDLKNSTSNIQDVFKANGTEYIDMTCFNGSDYADAEEDKLYDLMRRMKALATVIKSYHDNGFLHLDIKPENIFVMPETPEMVMLFDFDSVTEKEKATGYNGLSYTAAWAAPEQKNPSKYKTICEATDLFAIGEMIFARLMGRHSVKEDRRYFSRYEYDYEASIFKDVNPRVYPLLDELFHHTIGVTVKNRFQNAEELIHLLDKIIKLADQKEPYIKTNLPHPQGYFVGRDVEMEEIHRRLDENPVLFLSGVGGIGKSELAKRYAQKYEKKYGAIVFAPVVSDIDSIIYHVPIYNFDPYLQENPNDYLNRKWKKLKELAGKDILMIVDNLDKADDPKLADLLDLGCKILVTTRCDFSEYGYEQVNIDAISNSEEIKSIFHEHYKRTLGEESEKCVDEIISIVGGHTMTVELLAKQMSAGRIVPEKMLERLQQGGIGESGKEKVRTVKDEQLSAQSAYEHIKMLFDLSGLDEKERYILANLSLVPITGISTELFHDLCELEDYDTVNDLFQTGWIRRNKEDYISLHPVIADLAIDMLEESDIDISKLLNGLKELSENSDNGVSEFESKKTFADFLYGVSNNVLKLNKGTEDVASFLSVAQIEFKDYGYFKFAITCIKKSIKIFFDLFGESCNGIATSYIRLGILLEKIGELEKAEQYYLKALRIRKKLFGEEHCETANAYNNLGIFNKYIGNFQQAEDYYLKSLKIWQKTQGEEYNETANLYNNLAELYIAEGRIEEAKDYCFRALKIRTKVFGEKHRDIADSYNSLGHLFFSLSKFKDAENYCLKSLEIRKELFGENHGDVAELYSNLGAIYDGLRQLNKSKECNLKALTIREQIYGKNHADTAVSYINLGQNYKDMGLFYKAEQYYLQALRINIGSFTPLLYNNLGELYQAENKLDKAEEYFFMSINCRKEFTTNESPDIGRTELNLGRLYVEMKRFQDAKEHVEKAYEIFKSLLGDDNKDTKEAYTILCELKSEV